jgi:hypothetical protein
MITSRPVANKRHMRVSQRHLTGRSAPNEKQMSERLTINLYRRQMERRDRILSKTATPLPPTENHLSIAVLEAWLDHLIGDRELRQQLMNSHPNGEECSVCLENLEYYRILRDEQKLTPEL